MLSQKNNFRRPFSIMKKLKGNESGVTLLETLVALAILGLVAVAFLNGLTTATQATIIADEQATAESLARSQMEYVKNQLYDTSYTPAPIPGEYEDEGYSATITVLPLPDPNNGTLEGIQEITVTVYHRDKEVLEVVDYKVDR